MLTRAYTSGGCFLGAIFGTGTNGAYVEEVANIKKLAKTHPEETKMGGYMIVNTEWGAFNNSVCDSLSPLGNIDAKILH
jgi:hexokinase